MGTRLLLKAGEDLRVEKSNLHAHFAARLHSVALAGNIGSVFLGILIF